MYDGVGFYGEIRLFAGTFPPSGWMFCEGQLLETQQYPALYSLIGINYGGDGKRTFALPNLKGRVPIGQGYGPSLTPRSVGQVTGLPSYTLTTAQMPQHTHAIACNNTPAAGTLNTPANNFWAASPVNRSTGRSVNTRYATSPTNIMANTLLTPSGTLNPAAVSNMQPTLGLNFIICVVGGEYPYFP